MPAKETTGKKPAKPAIKLKGKTKIKIVKPKIKPSKRRKADPIKEKCSKAELYDRVTIILEMKLAGLNRRQILQNTTKNASLNWNVEERQIDAYIHEANKIIKTYADVKKDELLGECIGRYNFLYSKMVNAKDYKGALSAVKYTTDLVGINAVVKSEVDLKNSGAPQTTINVLQKLTNAELRTLVDLQRKSGTS